MLRHNFKMKTVAAQLVPSNCGKNNEKEMFWNLGAVEEALDTIASKNIARANKKKEMANASTEVRYHSAAYEIVNVVIHE